MRPLLTFGPHTEKDADNEISLATRHRTIIAVAKRDAIPDLAQDGRPHLLTPFNKFNGHLLACGKVDR